MRGRKDSKSSTCTESAEVDAAGISGKVGALTRGGLRAGRREATRSIGRCGRAVRSQQRA